MIEIVEPKDSSTQYITQEVGKKKNKKLISSTSTKTNNIKPILLRVLLVLSLLGKNKKEKTGANSYTKKDWANLEAKTDKKTPPKRK